MKCIKIITDQDLNLETFSFNNPKIRKGARGIVINNDGKIAVFHKSNKNEYKLPGGGIELGESPKEAFKREILEETGCEVEIIKELGTIEEHKSKDNFQQVSYIFVSKVTKNTNQLYLTDKEKDEGAKLLWKNENEALQLITDCYEKLIPSKYEDVYHTKFIVTRDRMILQYYIDNKNK